MGNAGSGQVGAGGGGGGGGAGGDVGFPNHRQLSDEFSKQREAERLKALQHLRGGPTGWRRGSAGAGAGGGGGGGVRRLHHQHYSQQAPPHSPPPIHEDPRRSRGADPGMERRGHRGRKAKKKKKRKATRPPVKVIRTHPVHQLDSSHPEQDDNDVDDDDDDDDDDDSFDDDSTITSRPDLFHVEHHFDDSNNHSPTEARLHHHHHHHNKHKPYFPDPHVSPSSSGQHKLENHSERTSATERESSGGGSSSAADRFVLSVRSPDGTYLPPLGRHGTEGSHSSATSSQQRQRGASTPPAGLPPLPLQTHRNAPPNTAVGGGRHNTRPKTPTAAVAVQQSQFQPFEQPLFPPSPQQQDFAAFPAFTEDLFASSRGGAAPSVGNMDDDDKNDDDDDDDDVVEDDWPAPSFAVSQETFDPFHNNSSNNHHIQDDAKTTTTTTNVSLSSKERQNLQQILQLTPEAQRALLAGGTASKSTQKLLEAVLDPNLAASVIAAASASQRASTPSVDGTMSASTPKTSHNASSPTPTDPPTPHTHNKSHGASKQRSQQEQQYQQQQHHHQNHAKKTQIEEPREIVEKKKQKQQQQRAVDRSDAMSVTGTSSVFSASNRNFMEQCYQDSSSVSGDTTGGGGGGGGGEDGTLPDDATLTSMSTAAISTMSKSARSLGLRRRYRRTRQNPSRRSSRRWSSRSRIIVDENRAFEAMMHSGIIWADIPRPAKVTAVALTHFAGGGDKKPLLMAVGTDDGCVAVMEVLDDGSVAPDPFLDPKKAAADKNNKVRRLRELHRDAKIRSLDFSPDGRFLAVAGDDCTAAIVDVGETPALDAPASVQAPPLTVIQEVSREDRICSAKFSPDGALLAMGGFDGMVAIALTGPSLVAVTEGHAAAHAAPAEVVAEIPRLGLILSVDWSPDGTMLAIGGSDKKVGVVVATSSSKSRGAGGGGASVADAPSIVGGKSLGAVSSVGNSSIGGGGVSESSIAISEDDEDDDDPGWEVLGEVPRSSAVLCARWSPDGKCLAVACQDGTVSVVDLESRKIVKEIRKGKPAPPPTVTRPSLADGAIRTATGRSTGTLATLGTFGGLSVSGATTAGGGGAGSNRINAVCWSPDGSFLALGGSDDCCTIVETTSYVRVHEVPRSGHLMTVEWVGGGAAGPYLVTGGDDRAVAIVKTGGGNNNNTYNNNNNYNSPNGTTEAYVGTVSSSQQMDWVLREGAFTDAQEINALHNGSGALHDDTNNNLLPEQDPNETALVIHSVAFSRNDAETNTSPYLALAGSDGEVAVISTQHWGIEAELTLPCTIRSLKFSPDNRILALGGDSGCLYVVSVENWELLFELNTPHAIWALDFSVDGRRLALGCADGHLRMIGKERNGTWGIVGEMTSSTPTPILSLDWSSNGKHLAVGKSDGTVSLFRVEDVVRNHFVPQAEMTRGTRGSSSGAGGGGTSGGAGAAAATTTTAAAPVHTVAFGAGGKFLAVGGGDWTVAVYRLKSSWKLCHELKMDGWVQQVSWSPDGRYLGLGGTGLSRGAVVLDTISWEPVEELAGGVTFPVSSRPEESASLDWSQDGNWFVVAGLGGVSRVIHVDSWEVAHSINHFVAPEGEGEEEGEDEEEEEKKEKDEEAPAAMASTSDKLVTINETADDGGFFDPFGAQASAEGWTAFPSDDMPYNPEQQEVVDDEASMAPSFKFDASGRSSSSSNDNDNSMALVVVAEERPTVDAMAFPPPALRKPTRRNTGGGDAGKEWGFSAGQQAAAAATPPTPQKSSQHRPHRERVTFDRSIVGAGEQEEQQQQPQQQRHGRIDLSASWVTHETVKTFHDVSRLFLGRLSREAVLPASLKLFVQSVEMLRAHLKWALTSIHAPLQHEEALLEIFQRATWVMQRVLKEAATGWWITTKKYDVSVPELQRLKKWNDAIRRNDPRAALVDINVLVLVDS